MARMLTDGADLRRRVTWGVCGLMMLFALVPRANAQDGQKTTIAHGISTFGDLRYPADFKHLDYVNPEAPKGGEMSVWAFGGFDSMNPYTIKGRAGALASIFFESLMESTADEIGASYCLVCSTLEYPEDRSWVIFNIRPEARFADGTSITAEDVVFSYEILLKKGLPDFRAVLGQQVEKATVLGPSRVRYDFKTDFPTRDLPATVGGLPIFSKAFYEKNNRNFEESSLKPLLGSGAYVLDRLDVGQTIVYRSNPGWWGRDLPINVGRYNFETLRVEYYADYNAAFEGFKGGSYTFRNEASSILWATGYDFPAVAAGQVLKRELADGSIATGQSFIFNLRRPQFQDPRVREAIGLMFNFEWSNEKLFYGLYERINSLWENSDLAAPGLPTPAELALLQPLADLLPPGVLDQPPVMAAKSGERQLDRGNLRRASKLLDEAGWPVGNDGIRRNAAGEKLRVEFLNDSQTFDRVINPYIENLRALGVDAMNTRVDNAQMTNRERSYDFDIITDSLRMNYIPGSELKQYFGSETADISTFNKMGLKSEVVDRLIKVVLAAKSKEDLATATHALDRVLRALRFWVPQWYKDVHTVAYYDMYEHPKTMPPFALGNLDFWWFNADKAQALRSAGAIR